MNKIFTYIMFMKKSIFILLLLLLVTAVSFSQELPEFSGIYIMEYSHSFIIENTNIFPENNGNPSGTIPDVIQAGNNVQFEFLSVDKVIVTSGPNVDECTYVLTQKYKGFTLSINKQDKTFMEIGLAPMDVGNFLAIIPIGNFNNDKSLFTNIIVGILKQK